MISQSLISLGKSRCDIPSGTTQEWACPFFFPFEYILTSHHMKFKNEIYLTFNLFMF
jgi:hypothetical protein